MSEVEDVTRPCKTDGTKPDHVRSLTPDAYLTTIKSLQESSKLSSSCPFLSYYDENEKQVITEIEKNPAKDRSDLAATDVHENLETEIDSKDTNKEENIGENILIPQERRFNRYMTSDVKPNTNVSFERLHICYEILMALAEKGWKWPSPIQEYSIPKILTGKNLIARSKNGTGKTGAYSVALLNKINIKNRVQVIILVPTRELALQTASVCISISKYQDGLHVMVATGGTDLAEDIYRLNNTKEPVQVVVGSPKRILDLIYHNHIRRENVTSLVFDEADKLLSTIFLDPVQRILKILPSKCQKILVSATFPVSIKQFVSKYLGDCEQCNLMNELTLKGVTQYYAYLKEDQKISCLRQLLETIDVKQSIIFCNSTMRVELLAKRVMEMGFSCYYIHSKMSQESRNKAFHDFRLGYVTNLICTDLMTRGIDVPAVNVVFNFDFPKFADTYLHRIGRCGRFGHLAIAINFITDYDKDLVSTIGKQLGNRIYAIPRVIDKRLYVPSYQIKEKVQTVY